MWPLSSALGRRLRWRRWRSFELWDIYLECGNVESRKSVHIRKSLFREACLRSILSRVVITNTRSFFRTPVRSLSSYYVHHIYSTSHKSHKMTDYGLHQQLQGLESENFLHFVDHPRMPSERMISSSVLSPCIFVVYLSNFSATLMTCCK